MDTPQLLKFFFAFVFVMSLMFLLSWGLKRLGLAGQSLLPNSRRRLKIVETLPLDLRRKLVIVRRDNREHLIILGPSSETVVEHGIIAADDDTAAAANVVGLPQKEQKAEGTKECLR
ncbi:MAG: flagellar biosynthetic protein FliO [Micavibrio sp.]|nr:flagellar biosynthetic protein FliO [Micavibrio sp.]